MHDGNPLQEVIDILGSLDFVDASRDFENHVVKLADPDASVRAQAARAIEQRCQPRWLGDLYIPGVSLQGWWGLLERASQFARRLAAEALPTN